MQAQWVNDGDFSAAAQNGLWTIERPFADRGDSITFIARRKMRMLPPITRPVLMSTSTFTGEQSVSYPTVKSTSAGAPLFSGAIVYTTPAVIYLLGVSQATPVDDGSGLVEWEEEWGNVPAQRLEWGSTTYTQVLNVVDNVPRQFNLPFDAYNIFEYAVQPLTSGFDNFQYVQIAGTNFPLPVPELPTLTAPRLIDLGDGILRTVGGPAVTLAQITAEGLPILAQDSDNSIYRCRIICRHSVWVIKKALSAVSP